MEKMLTDIKFLKENKYINDIEYSNFKFWILEDKFINNQEYLETLSCWLIEGIINKKEYFSYIKEIWGKDLIWVNIKQGNYIYSFDPYVYSQNIFLSKKDFDDKRKIVLSVLVIVITIGLTIWFSNIL